MRALVYHGPNDIGVEERPDPQPGPDQVLLRITKRLTNIDAR